MFKMNSFALFFFVSMLAIPSLGIESTTQPSETKECNQNKLLIRAQSGLYFYLESNTTGRTSITYDCTLGNSDVGTINVSDSEHPPGIVSLLIKNCQFITVDFTTCRFGTVHITNVKEVRIYGRPSSGSELVISDVKNLNVADYPSDYDRYGDRYDGRYNTCPTADSVSLILKNVVLKNLDWKSFKSLFMTGVIANSIALKSFSQLRIKDSSFADITDGDFSDDLTQVYIVNNTFERISPRLRSFNFYVNESFVFSDNHVKKVFGSIHIVCPKVEIVGNTIDFEKKSSFTIKLSDPKSDESIFKSLNVSSNVFQNDFPLELDENSEPDFITIERNYFNCSCKTALNLRKRFNSKSNNILAKFLLDDYKNNVCVNFENCPLKKALGQEVSICSNTFVCPEDFSDVSAITLNELSSELKNLTEALHLVIGKNQKFKYSEIASTENYPAADGV